MNRPGTSSPPGELVGLDLQALQRWFAVHVPDADGELQAELIHGGRSNLTYAITDGRSRWVLRRPPLGPIAPSANDLGREFRVMAALAGSAVPVPAAVAYCDDVTVMGCPFAVVEHVEGLVVRGRAEAAALDPAVADRCSRSLVTALAALHDIDPATVGLDQLGRAAGYVERQVRRWGEQWRIVATRAVPEVDELHRRLARSVPSSTAVGIVHGDYRLDNTILRPDDPGTIAAVIDWEMATLGDPRADLGLLLVYWDPISADVLPDGHAVSANPGFPSAAALRDDYGRVAGATGAGGADLEDLDFFVALGCFKLAVIAEGIHQRFIGGLTVGEGFERVGRAVAPLATRGLELVTG